MKTVLITGGTGGIGRALVRAFSESGYAVAFTYKSNAAVAEELSRDFRALAIRADGCIEGEVDAAVRAVLKEYGRLDCLVNNAAVSAFSLFTDITLDEWNRMLATNLTSAFLYSRAAIPDMLSRKTGRIINISSMWGLVGASCEVHYSAAKAGLIGFTKALAKEVGPSGITVNAIAPGVIETDMNRALSEEDLSALKEETPIGRLGAPLEVARAALFLCSEDAGFITGEILNLSGGFITP